MNLMPISWHEECLKNSREFLAQKEKQLASLQDDIRQLVNDISHYECQILLAKKAGKETFDRYHFEKNAGICPLCNGKGQRPVMEFDNSYQPTGRTIMTECCDCRGSGIRK